MTEFDDIVSGLELETDPEVELPHTMDDLTLVRRYHAVREELLETRQMANWNPDTQEARDLHSLRDALLFELGKRGLG